jgi:hypothetical protein
MSVTSGVDLMLVAFRALSAVEQRECFAHLAQLRLTDNAQDENETARFLRSLRRVAETLGEAPTANQYRDTVRRLAEEGEALEPASRVIRHFGTWRLAKEALDLSTVTSARSIDARFRSRRLGKIWRYREDTLVDTMRQCVEAIGHVPQVAEFDWWRQQQLDLARARGDELHLPSASPYRKRWGTWEAALRHFGYTAGQIDGRFDRP